MEPAKIDWKNIDSKFVEDKLYEHINAPKWFDFLASYEHSVDDDAWFCRPDCNHPKTAQDFLRSTPSKLSRTNDVSEIPPLGDRTQREAKLKRRGLLTHTWVSPNSNFKFNESSENQNPNLSTPPPPNYNHVKTMKAAIKSSTEKKEPIDDASQNNDALPMLKNTLSARNLFVGRDILNQITEFCNELKRLATRSKERENVVRLNVRKSVEEGVKEEVKKEEIKGEVLGELNWRDRERKPFLEINHEKSQGIDKSSVKKRLINKNDNAENIPISVNLEYVKRKGEETLLQIRTNPPSPQCFSATRVPAGKTTPSKVSKSKLMERGILQEQNNKTKEEEYYKDKGKSLPMVDGREARTLDVFWFLKPCTLST